MINIVSIALKKETNQAENKDASLHISQNEVEMKHDDREVKSAIPLKVSNPELSSFRLIHYDENIKDKVRVKERYSVDF